MNSQQVFTVSIWEFRRFCKVKDLLVTLVLSVVVGLGYIGATAVIAWNTSKDLPRVVVRGADLFAFDASAVLEIEPAGDRDDATLRCLVDDGDLDGLLILHSVDQAELVTRGDRLWQEQLQSILDAALRDARLRDSDLAAEDLTRLTAPFHLTVTLAGSQTAEANTWAKITAGVFIGLMLLGIMLGNTYLFMGITGEKQHRVTEQVIAAISPQCWIDGKILGLSLMVFVMLANMCLGGLLANVVLQLFGTGIELSSIPVAPMLVAKLVVVTLLGFFFWFAFFAGIAATIDDPNTSSRGLFLFLPMLPLAVAFFAFVNPDTLLMRALGVFPLTAPTVLPARMILTDVSAWEIAVAVVLLIASIWGLRRVAGKIFALGILVHGTEPSWRDMWRQLRAS